MLLSDQVKRTMTAGESVAMPALQNPAVQATEAGTQNTRPIGADR